MSLEEVLRIIEKSDTDRRNPERYFFTIFGTPAENGTWGYRDGRPSRGQNFTIVNGKVIGAPSFFGSNPAEVGKGRTRDCAYWPPKKTWAATLLNALDGEQKKVAIVDQTAYKDIITAASRKAALQGPAQRDCRRPR